MCAIVHKLLEKGADPMVMNNAGKTTLDLARDIGHQLLIDILEKGSIDFGLNMKKQSP